ncbi:hypothetical protein [Pandoraea communis]|uniref:hypothetical protein n=1 Tax=Pandoraea communis TaxID=2508297 RepID=UPI0025A4FD67|nr:hypothetical protein [Pandoraea communis]MDM8356631.1 hypothetical protein [Pandoraea communis]
MNITTLGGRLVRQKARPLVKGVLLMSAGAAISTGIAVWAQQSASGTSTTTDCVIAQAAQDALNRRIQMVGVTQPDPSKYFTVGGVSSCIGALSSIDLSNLIPDPMNWISSAVKQVTQMAVQAACTAARNSLSDFIGKYNYAAGLINGGGASAVNYLDSSLGKAVGVSLNTYGTNYAAPPGTKTVIDPLAGLTNAANNTVGTAVSGATQAVNTATNAADTAVSNATQTVTAPVKGAVSEVSSMGSKLFGSN